MPTSNTKLANQPPNYTIMTNQRPSPPKLAIPASHGSPSGASAATQTGRPSMWTKSAQRKMTRLYVYTTLPLAKIVELVHCHTPEPAPGLESANKKLNVLLDKQPRWLHPRNEDDMDRRVTELANSPTRLRSASNAASGHSRSNSHSSRISSSPQRLKMEDSVSPAALFDVPDVHRSSITFAAPSQGLGPSKGLVPHDAQSFTTMSPAEPPQQLEDAADQHHFSKFLRQTTCLSNSTNHTTGSFHRVLSNYSESYVQTVKRLVKRFTAPIATQSSLSPYSEGNSPIQTWANEQDCPPRFTDRPSPIPGDFLRLDQFSTNRSCCSTPDAHATERCICSMPMDNSVLPWVTREGITLMGQRLLTQGPTQEDVKLRDSFGNTVLHFIAARGSIAVLEHSLTIDVCKSLIGAKNSAGQTFLHVLNPSIFENTDGVKNLLNVVVERGCDIYTRDHYGRSFFHTIQAGEHSEELIQVAIELSNRVTHTARDAFGFTLNSSDSNTSMNMDMDVDQPDLALQNSFSPISTMDPGIAKESKLLEVVRLARANPHLQDEEGRNGLHCLAMATLSSATVISKYHLQPPQQGKVSKKLKNSDKELDSSAARLEFRRGLLMGLLDAGVDLNQHDKNGNTVLMTFVAELPEDDDHKIPPEILKLLIDKGANVHARNRRGETALHVAVRCGKKLAMRALCENGANVHARDSAGRSLLDVADVKMMNCESDERMCDYAHYEACRAWLSGKGMALQVPTVLEEWGCEA